MSIERARSNAEPTRSNHWSSGECPVALGDRAPERRFHRQFPHTETKPFDLWEPKDGRKRGRVQEAAAARRWRSRSRSLKQRWCLGRTSC